MRCFAFISALSFVALALIASRQHVFSVDYTIQSWVQGERVPALETPMRTLTLLGSGYVLAPLAALGWFLLRRAGHPLARYVPATGIGAFVLDALSKWLVARPRPRGTAYGFPSGHTLGAVIFFAGLVYALWTSRLGRAWRWLGTLLSVLLVVGVGYSRLYLRAHWASDVVGGLTGGAGYVLFVLAGIDRAGRPASSGTSRDTA